MAYQKNLKKDGMGHRSGRSSRSVNGDWQEIKKASKRLRRMEEKELSPPLPVAQANTMDCPITLPEVPDFVKNRERRLARRKALGKMTKGSSRSFMSQEQVNELCYILTREKLIFPYFKDRYSFLLLKHAIEKKTTIKEIKNSRYKKLLNRPQLKELCSTTGNGILDAENLDQYWPQNPLNYRLTFTHWGEERPFYNWLQTSRPGMNLVLQLNFPHAHDVAFSQIFEEGDNPFVWQEHPVNINGKNTLAWSRMDIAADLSYALIEEIQNDWIRCTLEQQKRLLKAQKENEFESENKSNFENLKAINFYIKTHLQPYIDLWQEAVLSATIWLLKEEIGVERIYYHSFESGNFFKEISYKKPPRSLYTKLPEKFCFELCKEHPPFLQPQTPLFNEQNPQKHSFNFYKLDFDKNLDPNN